jgi:tetratricopeptide (TPR) repeat protein
MPRQLLNVGQETLAKAIERASAMHRGGWLYEAEKVYDEILKVAPGHVEALHLLGLLYQQYGRPEDALRLIDKALAIAPGDTALRRMRAEALDRIGSAQRHFRQPLWLGESNIVGKTILLHAEQGFGDTLQFMRYANVVTQMGARAVLEVQPQLRRLASSSFPDLDVVARGDALPPFDLHVPLPSLPHACGTTRDPIPWAGPYLEPAVELLATWARDLPSPKKLRVGIVWAGEASQDGDNFRSPALSSMRAVMSLSQIAFISLQHEQRDGDVDILAQYANVTRLARGFSDFADTAAVIAQLDCIVAVDSAVAHLAAAMGKPVLLLLPFGGDWHWVVRGRTDRSWYPTVHLYRQHVAGDWSAALEAVRQELIRRAP